MGNLVEPFSADLDFGTGEWSCSAWANIPATLPAASFPVVSSELVNNSDFSQGTTGWGINGSLTFSVSSGIATTVAGSTTAGIFQDITTSASTVLVTVRARRIAGTDISSIIIYNRAGFATTISNTSFSNNEFVDISAIVNTGNGGVRVYIQQRNTTVEVDSISVLEVSPALIADRAYSSGANINLGITATGLLTATAFDGTTTRTVTTTAAYKTATWLKAEACYTTDGTLSIRVNGTEVATTRGNPLLTLNNSNAVLTIGNSFALDAPFPGSLAMVKLSATVPTIEQSVWMYEQEKQLFRSGVNCVLPDSGAVVDLTYDDATDKWIAVSATNESEFSGLVRTSVTPVPAGSYTRTVANSGVQMLARSTANPGVDVTIPAYGLREELVKRAEAAARLNAQMATYDYVGGFTANTTNGNTAILSVANLTYPTRFIGARVSGSGIPTNATIVAVSGTTIYLSAAATATATGVAISFADFILPVGMEAKEVSLAGEAQREGASAQYTRLYDGFKETIRFGTPPSNTALIQIQAVRGAQ
jgi:hypothetical protein